MPTYTVAPVDVTDLINEVIAELHPELAEAGVTVGCLLAYPTASGHAVTHHGYPAQATIKITNLKDRVAGLADAQLILDAERWEQKSTKERNALLHHELLHLTTARDKAGKIKRDRHGRPKLAARLHDFVCEGFWDVVDRFKEASPEAGLYQGVHKEFSQRLFPWG